MTKKYSGICYEDKSLSETVGDWNSFARKVSGILYDNSLIREMIPHIVTVKDWITILSGDLFLARNRIAILLSGLFSAMNWII